MKQEKVIGAALALINFILIIFCFVRYLQLDRTAPKFLLESTDIVYVPDMDGNELAEGITANDNRDGDVTDRIVIEKITEKREEHTAVVYYAVCDSSGNTAKLSKLFHADYPEEEKGTDKDSAPDETDGQDADSGQMQEENTGGLSTESKMIETEEKTESEPETEEESAGETAESAGADVQEEDGEAQGRQEELRQEEEQSDAEGKQAESENDESRQQEGEQSAGSQAPQLVLGSSDVTISAGTNPPWTEIITTLWDDQDDYATLYYNLHVSQYNRNKPGIYPVTVYVEDSDGNRSAEVPFTIIVREN